MKDYEFSDGKNTKLLRVGVIFLAVVSFFTTANGMKKYIFIDNSSIAYSASAAIQGILLALGMNLPNYLHGICSTVSQNIKKESDTWWKKTFRFIKKSLSCLVTLLLTIVTIACSSWFSYVYIADVIHQNSWETDSELIVQQTYRKELYDSQEYANTYQIYLEGSIGDKILQLESLATKLGDSEPSLNMDWNEERNNFLSSENSMVGSYMSPVIDAMEKAMETTASQTVRDLAATSILDARKNIENRMAEIQESQNILEQNINVYNNNISDLNRQISNAQEGVDISYMSELINNNLRLIASATRRLEDLQTEYLDLEQAYGRLPIYENRLGLSSSTSTISIRSNLLQLQSEFFQQNPNEEIMLGLAEEIFDNLRNASHKADTAEPDTLTYTDLLSQMNWLIRDLKNYARIKGIEISLNDMISELHATNANSISETESSDNDDEANSSSWKTMWVKRVTALNAQISVLPVYVGKETTEGEIHTLSEVQEQVLISYDRDKSNKNLDDMIRRYIATHNAIYQGIIYLESPYRSLALFALILALSFDLSGFVFGFVEQNNTQQENFQDTNDLSPQNEIISNVNTSIEETESEWSHIKTLTQYLIVTGDYECHDGVYYYKTFRDGVVYSWIVNDTKPYSEGIYIPVWTEDGLSHGTPISMTDQPLCFAHQATNIQDGIYVDCCLGFDSGSLVLNRNSQSTFICTIDEYVPVYKYNPDYGECETLPVKQLTVKDVNSQLSVVALNDNGTMVCAIYIIENSTITE